MGFITGCPACDEEIEITDSDIRKAKRKAASVGGLLLKGCPNCCRVMVLDGEALTRLEAAADRETDATGDESWLPCLELTGVVAKMPAGGEEHMGIWMYRPGGGGDAMERWPYMATYGIDPACALKKMRR